MPESRSPTIAIVDDDAQLRQVFVAALQDDCNVLEADSGESALDLIDDEVDLVLLDRKMPGLTGKEVLDELRGAGFDGPVAMITGEQPDFDILEMGFDEYVVKPIGVEELRELVETLLLAKEYDEAIREYFALASKLASLRSTKDPDELSMDERFVRAEGRLEELEERARRSLDKAFDTGRFEKVIEESASTERILEGSDVDGDPDGGDV